MNHLRRTAFLGLLAALLPSCETSKAAAPGAPMFRIVLDGGSATGSSTANSAFGGMGGILTLTADKGPGDATFGGLTPLPFPDLTPMPTTGTVVSALSPSTPPVTSGNLLIPGTLAATGSGALTLQCDHGDILISGDLRAGAGNTLDIKAPFGTIFITGSVRTSSNDGVPDGTPGAALTLLARSIVVLGTLDTRGEDHPAGAAGAGGMLRLTSTGEDILLSGTFLTSGGAGTGGNGGKGGDVTLQSAVDLHLLGALSADGGSANTTTDSPVGGTAGSIQITTRGSFRMNAAISARGGDATTTGTGATGGMDALFKGDIGGLFDAYGDLLLRKGNATAASGTVGNPILAGSNTTGPVHTVSASMIQAGVCSVSSRGGDSSDTSAYGGIFGVFARNGNVVWNGDIDLSGGTGGNSVGPLSLLMSGYQFQMTASEGQVNFSGTITGRGGDAGLAPGNGARVVFTTFTGSGGAHYISGTFELGGGSSTSSLATNAPGGAGGLFGAATYKGKLFLLPGTVVHADGGDSTGTGIAGAGGELILDTDNYLISASGTLTFKGGTAKGPGGTGGAGGKATINSDNNNIGLGGPLTFETGSTLDVSAGSGTIGGNGDAAAVRFLGDAMNKNLAGAGIVVNNGTITARGGAPDGNGGNVLFDGLNALGVTGPDPGVQDRSGMGAGTTGSFTPQ